MIYRFLLVSDEVENFRREIKIDADATFFDFHKIIMECNGYEGAEMTSFFMCDEEWRRRQEITLVEIETDSDVDSYVMKDEILSDWLDEEKQKLMFVFDNYNDRGFYIELAEMILGKSLSKPSCKKQGDAPVQFLKKADAEDSKPMSTPTPIIDSDDDFYGDDAYDMDELDAEGFEGLDDVEPEDSDLEFPEDIELI